MIHVLREFACAAAIVALASPTLAAPVFVTGGQAPVPRTALDLPFVTVNCEDDRPEPQPREGGGPSEGFRFGDASTFRIYKACDGKGQNHDQGGSPQIATIAEVTTARGIEHCGAYTDVWRVDCLSSELERLARRMPDDRASRQARTEILAAAAELRALAEANADPAQPPVRRAAEVDGRRITTTRPITAVAPDRVVATNLAADKVISELSTTLLRSASSNGAAEFARVAAAVDSTKVLLRST